MPASTLQQKRGAPGETPEGVALAAVDVGSNAIRLQIVSVRPTGAATERESLREPVRLGHRVFMTGMLEESGMDRAVSVLAAFHATMKRHGVVRSRCVATSAVREAQNRDLFIERVANVAGLDLEVISGAEEARLLSVAIQRRIDLTKKRALLIDIGGGSVEFAVVQRGSTVLSQSHRLGAVRLAELFLEGPRRASDKKALVEEYLDRMLADLLKEVRRYSPDIVLAIGGNAEAIVKIGGNVKVNGSGPEAGSAGPHIASETLRTLADRFIELTPEERAKKYDLRPDRVDTIVPATVLLNFILDRLDLKSFHAPGVGLRDGMLAELIDQAAGRFDRIEAERGVIAEAERLGEHYNYDAAHARKVREHALSIFDCLRSRREVQTRDADRDRTLLAVAATVHDVGEFVGYAHHHKHGYYIISNSEIGGLSSDDLQIVATAVRFHRRAHPTDRHPEYAGLPREERKRASRIAAILRLADALDREHRQRIESLHIQVRRGEFLLNPRSKGDCMLERWALESKGELFREVFGLRPRWSESTDPVSSMTPAPASARSRKHSRARGA